MNVFIKNSHMNNLLENHQLSGKKSKQKVLKKQPFKVILFQSISSYKLKAVQTLLAEYVKCMQKPFVHRTNHTWNVLFPNRIETCNPSLSPLLRFVAAILCCSVFKHYLEKTFTIYFSNTFPSINKYHILQFCMHKVCKGP